MSTREEVSQELVKNKNIEIKNKDWKVIKELQKSDRVFLNPDEGKQVVVLDKEAYKKAAEEHLDSDNYEIIRFIFPKNSSYNLL